MKKYNNKEKGTFMKFLSLSAIALSVAMVGCSPTTPPPQSAGGDDFPNAQVLGKIIVDNLSKGEQWADSIALPAASSPAAIAQSVSVPSAPSSGLTKKTNTSLTLHFDFSDTSHGVVRVDAHLVSDSAIKNDTFLILYDDAFRDSIKNNEHLYMLKGKSTNKKTLITTSYLFIDSDGDSIINNQDGKPNRVFVSSSSAFLVGAVRKFEIEIDAGKDGNLDTKEDLRILQCQSLSLGKNNDTLSMVRYENYGGDSALFDASVRDSFFIRVRLVDTDILSRRTDAEAVFLMFPLDSSKNHPVYFRSAKSLSSGAVARSIVRSPRPDSLFSANDTALAYIIVDSPDNIVNLDTFRMRIVTGENPADMANNSLIELFIHQIKRRADERETLLTLTSDQPVAKGQKLQSGSLSLYLIHADGGWISLIGSFMAAGITAHYEDSQGNSINLEWDRNGEPVE